MERKISRTKALRNFDQITMSPTITSTNPRTKLLDVPRDEWIADAFRAEEFGKGWTPPLLDHSTKVQAALKNEDDVTNIILRDPLESALAASLTDEEVANL